MPDTDSPQRLENAGGIHQGERQHERNLRPLRPPPPEGLEGAPAPAPGTRPLRKVRLHRLAREPRRLLLGNQTPDMVGLASRDGRPVPLIQFDINVII